MNEARFAAALRSIGEGFMQLATALDNVQETPPVHQAAKQQKAVTETRAGRPPADEGDGRVVNINAGKAEKPAAASQYPAAALKALGKLDLAEATRPELKEVAEALGVYQQGQKASELRELLGGILKSQGPAAPAKGKKPAATPAPAEEEDDVEYPDTKTMKKEFKLFCKVNRPAIEEENPEFFNEDDDADSPQERLHQILADDAALKEAWKDNVYELKQANEWDDLLAEAEAQVG